KRRLVDRVVGPDQKQDRRALRLLGELGEILRTARARQARVEDQHRRPRALARRQGLEIRPGLDDVERVARQRDLDDLLDGGRIVGHEYAATHRSSLKLMANLES